MQQAASPSPVCRVFVIDPSLEVCNLIGLTLQRHWVVALQNYPDARGALLNISEGNVLVPDFVFLSLDPHPHAITNGYQATTSFCAFSSRVFAILNQHNPLQAHNALKAGATATIDKPLSSPKVLNLAKGHIPLHYLRPHKDWNV